MDSVTPFLWIQHPIDEVVAFYTDTFTDIVVETPASPSRPEWAQWATLTIAGQRIHMFNAGPMSELTEAFSMMVLCATQEEIDHLWDRLGDGGRPSRCGWITDRFGVTWQIVPRDLQQWLSDPDRGDDVMAAMLQMDKLDTVKLLAALRGQ